MNNGASVGSSASALARRHMVALDCHAGAKTLCTIKNGVQGRRLEEVAEAVGGGCCRYCPLQTPLKRRRGGSSTHKIKGSVVYKPRSVARRSEAARCIGGGRCGTMCPAQEWGGGGLYNRAGVGGRESLRRPGPCDGGGVPEDEDEDCTREAGTGGRRCAPPRPTWDGGMGGAHGGRRGRGRAWPAPLPNAGRGGGS